MLNRLSFKYPDASGVVRTWVPKCCKCDKVPTKCSHGNPVGSLGYGELGFPITDYSAFYCDDHAPEWAVLI